MVAHHSLLFTSSVLVFSLQPHVPFLPVFSSMKRLIRYNLGSVAIGSLILSFMESIRFMLESIRRKLKVAGIAPDNWFGKAAFRTSRFCLRCIEWTIKSFNRNAYIMVSMERKKNSFSFQAYFMSEYWYWCQELYIKNCMW